MAETKKGKKEKLEVKTDLERYFQLLQPSKIGD